MRPHSHDARSWGFKMTPHVIGIAITSQNQGLQVPPAQGPWSKAHLSSPKSPPCPWTHRVAQEGALSGNPPAASPTGAAGRAEGGPRDEPRDLPTATRTSLPLGKQRDAKEGKTTQLLGYGSILVSRIGPSQPIY